MDNTLSVTVILITIAGTVAFMMLLYMLFLCISSLRRKNRNNREHVSIRPRSIAGLARVNQETRRQLARRRATDNTYLTSPQARLPETHSITTRGGTSMSIPSRILLRTSENPSNVNGHEVEIMRFYTPEELLHFPFEEHQRQLSELLEQERRDNAARIPEMAGRQRRSSRHHSLYVTTGPGMIPAASTATAASSLAPPESVIISRDDRDRRCLSSPPSPIYQYIPQEGLFTFNVSNSNDSVPEEEPPAYEEAIRLDNVKEPAPNSQ